MAWRGCSVVLVAVTAPVLMPGCAVGQKAGAGQVMALTERGTGAYYWLYLPDGYDAEVAAGRHPPLVMTFHGMKPFDNAHSQIREWQQEADRYGFVVCAPVLNTPDLFGPLPLKQVPPSLERDERRILAVMDELERTTGIDPNAVLATCWSYGGYVAHYMANRHPERFSCIVVKQANFSSEILDPQTIPRYRANKVAIFYNQNDFKLCREESKAAAQWYHRHGFDVKFAVFQDLGHERTPSLAAAFFATTCNATPKTPPVELARLKVFELPPSETVTVAATQLASAALPPSAKGRPPSAKGGPAADTEMVSSTPVLFDEARSAGPRTSGGDAALAARREQGGARRLPAAEPAPAAPAGRPVRTRPLPPPATPAGATPPRPRQATREVEVADSVRVRLSSTIGISPLLVSYSVAPLPPELRNGAFFLWMDNGEPISNGLNGQKLLTAPGTHELAVLVTAADGQEFRASETVTVLERLDKSGASK